MFKSSPKASAPPSVGALMRKHSSKSHTNPINANEGLPPNGLHVEVELMQLTAVLLHRDWDALNDQCDNGELTPTPSSPTPWNVTSTTTAAGNMSSATVGGGGKGPDVNTVQTQPHLTHPQLGGSIGLNGTSWVSIFDRFNEFVFSDAGAVLKTQLEGTEQVKLTLLQERIDYALNAVLPRDQLRYALVDY